MERAEIAPVVGTQTLLNGLNVVRAVAAGARTLKEIRDVVDLPRSTVHRLVLALRREGYLHDADAGVVLGPALISLGFAAIAANPLVDVARPILADLSAIVLDTVHLAIEDSDAVLYLAKLPGRRGAEMRSRVGLRMPLTRTGIGKSLLLDDRDRWRNQYDRETGDAVPDRRRFLEAMQVSAQAGVSLDLEENEPGIRCVAAPVRGPQGSIIAAISVSATAPYMTSERMIELTATVLEHAARISAALGARSEDATRRPDCSAAEQMVRRMFALYALSGS